MQITPDIAQQIGRFCHPLVVAQIESLVGIDTDVAVAALHGLTEINRAQRALVEEMVYVRTREAELNRAPLEARAIESQRELSPIDDFDDEPR